MSFFSSLSRVHAYLILHLLVLGRTTEPRNFELLCFLNSLKIPNFKLSKSSKFEFSNFTISGLKFDPTLVQDSYIIESTAAPPHLKTLVYCTKTYNVPSQPNLVKKIISKNFFSKMAVLVSIGIIAASLFLCDQIRNNIVTKWNPGLVQNLVLDAILAFELCGPALEFGVIFNHYGIGVWTIGKQYALKS